MATTEQATELGRDYGKDAASWVEIDSDEEACSILEDSSVIEAPSPFSGEWADGLTPQEILSELGYNDDIIALWSDGADGTYLDSLVDSFEEGYYQAFYDNLESSATRYLGTAPEGFDLDGRYTHPNFRGVALYVDTVYGERSAVVMVGDDMLHIVETVDLVPIPDESYCPGCGQIGCTADKA